jgi:hypothetical protein
MSSQYFESNSAFEEGFPRRSEEQRAGLQLGSELSGGTTLLALTSVAPAVATVPVTTTTATAEGPPLTFTVAAEHATGRRVRLLLLDVRSRDDLGREVKPLSEVVDALGGQGVVVVLPRELGLDISARVERLARLDHVEVPGVDVVVLGKVEVLLRDEYTLTEEVLMTQNRQFRQKLANSGKRAPGSRFTSWIFLRSALGISILAVGSGFWRWVR